MSEFSPPWAETRDMKPATTTSRIKAGGAGGPAGSTAARSAGSYRGFYGALKWGQKQRSAITSAVLIPKHLLPQQKIRGHPPERSLF